MIQKMVYFLKNQRNKVIFTKGPIIVNQRQNIYASLAGLSWKELATNSNTECHIRILSYWIRIQEGRNDPQKYKKYRIFMF
jgi:hypothetical protein